MLDFIIKFAYSWYIEDSKNFWSGVFRFIKVMDCNFGVVANVYNWTSPLYGDYSYIGKVAGPIFRTARIVIGATFYAGVIILGFVFYAAWLAIPPVITAMIIFNFLAVI